MSKGNIALGAFLAATAIATAGYIKAITGPTNYGLISVGTESTCVQEIGKSNSPDKIDSYLSEKLDCLPELKNSHIQGIVSKVVPLTRDTSDLEAFLNKVDEGRSPHDLIELREAIGKSKAPQRGNLQDSSIFPVPYGRTIGERFPEFIRLNPSIKNEYDARAILLRNIQYATDTSMGIPFDGGTLNSNSIFDHTYSMKFAADIIELRGRYTELIYTMKVVDKEGTWLGTQAEVYNAADSYLKLKEKMDKLLTGAKQNYSSPQEFIDGYKMNGKEAAAYGDLRGLMGNLRVTRKDSTHLQLDFGKLSYVADTPVN